jgi:hypothetical protein
MAWSMTIFSPEPSENRQGMTVLTIPLSEPSGAKHCKLRKMTVMTVLTIVCTPAGDPCGGVWAGIGPS